MKKRLIALAIIAVLIAGVWIGYGFIKKDSTPATAQNATAVVQRGDIEVNVSGSGSIAPEKEVVKSLQGGTVKSISFEEGDQVKKDQVLIAFEEEDASDQIRSQQLNLEQKLLDLEEAKEQEKDQIKNLKIYADESGDLISLDIEEGDEISANTVIGTIQNTNKKTVTVPYNEANVRSIKPGQEADVFLLSSLSEIKGTVEEVNTIGRSAAGNAVMYDVTIAVEGYKAIEPGAMAQVSVNTSDGKLMAIETGEIVSSPTVNIVAQTSGTVSKIYAKEQDRVKEGQLIAQLESDTASLTNNIKKIELEIEQIKDNIASYQEEQASYGPILSPIDGEVVTSNLEAGSKVNAGQEIAEIVNYNELTLVIPVDELDMPKVKIGQKANITVDALPDKAFSGEVIEIAKEGTAQNGVATFDVTVRLTEKEGIMAGMSAQASILVEQKQNILTLPIEAIQEMNGNKFVILAEETQAVGQSETQASSNNQRNRNMKEVEVGIHDESTIEIVSGLQEGEQVVIPTTSNSNQNSQRAPSGGIGGTRVMIPGGGGPR